MDKATRKVLATGTQDQMFSYVKHHVPDGLYILESTEMKIYVRRKDGVLEPDHDGVSLVPHKQPPHTGEKR